MTADGSRKEPCEPAVGRIASADEWRGEIGIVRRYYQVACEDEAPADPNRPTFNSRDSRKGNR